MQKALTPWHPSEDDRFLNLWFADDIDRLGSNEEELQQLAERLEKTAAGYGMKISSDKSKILVSSKPNDSWASWTLVKWVWDRIVRGAGVTL